jgi:hypothetical protein
MRHYGKQLSPLIFRLPEKEYENLSLKGDHLERALYRATLKACFEGESERSNKS